MQSSTGMFFRAVVMLACLIAIPLAALFGTKLPDMAKQTLGDRWKVIGDLLPGAHTEATAMSSPVQTASVSLGSVAAPTPNALQASTSSAPQWFDSKGPSGAAVPLGAAPAQPWGTAVPASYNEPVAASPGAPPSWPGQAGKSQGNDLNRMATAPSSPMGLVVGQATMAPPTTNSGDRFTHYLRRLQELGAVYYLLETWGERGQLFRFYCKVAVGGNPNYTRYFDAADGDPLAAMGKVVQQIEAWRSGAP